MKQDFSNTVATWEPTRYEDTCADDVFLPYVRVLISWSDIEAAVQAGAIVPSEAHVLWSNWAAPGSPTRDGATTLVRPKDAQGKQTDISLEPLIQGSLPLRPKFGLTKPMYYLGSLVAAVLIALMLWAAQNASKLLP